MNTRYITTIFLVLGMVVALFLTHSHLSRPSPIPFVGSPAAAQTPNMQSIRVEQSPSTGGTDDLWHRFEITLPKTSTPLDMHVAFLVDGHGEETVDMSPTARSQPLPFKYRLDYDDDNRVKAILEAQGLPVKKNLVTYTCAFESDSGGLTFSKTVRFRHAMGGQQEQFGNNATISGPVGQKIILQNEFIADEDFSGSFDKIMTAEQQSQPEYASKTPPGLVHHLVVYIQFKPHHGAVVTEHRSIGRSI